MSFPRLAALALTLPVLALGACGTQQAADQSAPSRSTTTSPSAATSPASPASSAASASPTRAARSTATDPAALTACTTQAATLDRDTKIGQLFMVATTGAALDPDVRALIAEHHIGSAFYLGNDTPNGVEATAVVSAQLLNAADGIAVLVAVDQEGGTVQRLQGPGFDAIPSAQVQADMPDAALTKAWARWGKQLNTAGVRMTLAPVVDVSPADKAATNEPIAKLRRGYGADDQTVAAKASAVVAGLHASGIASSAKHFPGIGRVTTNTDFGRAHDGITGEDDLEAFKAVMAAGVDSVMMSTVIYDKLDPDNHAAFSSKIVTDLLRGKLGWRGVVISDDLGSAQAVADITPADRAARFVAAGGDIVITADSSNLTEMVEGVKARAASDPSFAVTLDEHVGRVLALKQSVGIHDCTAG